MTRTAVPPPIQASELTETEGAEQRMVNEKHRAGYDWHLIMSHTCLRTLTKMAIQPHATDKSLEKIVEDRQITCAPCLRTKLKRAPHYRKEHDCAQGEAVCSDILGPIRPSELGQQNKGRPQDDSIELYFISFTDVRSRYTYTHNLHPGQRRQKS